ncbi:hypothetical protein C0993_011545 [Termitomyces sp. T159_Od127]|nr:hypothetical protein C0993_011545 [Termitomyces sp. T159_Od127]
MHEILAPLYYAIDFDSLSPTGDPDEADVREVCSRTWVAGDAWALFDSVMRGLSRWYEWREPVTNAAPKDAISPLALRAGLNIPDGRLNIEPYTAPIVDAYERLPEERPWARLELEKEISTLRSTNKRLGNSLGWIVDVLLQDEAGATEPQRLKKKKQEAIESLSYIRDVLLGSVDEIDDARLMGEKDIHRRRTKEARTMRAMMSSTSTIGSGRMSGTAGSGSGPGESDNRFSSTGTTVLTEVGARRAVDGAGQIQDPLGVGM